jgi:carboxylate-amine ligase
MTIPFDFKENDFLTIGVELELQLINLHTFNLAMEAEDFLRRLSHITFTGEIKPEITQSMIEINSSIHKTYGSLLNELNNIRTVIKNEADKTYIGVCGGGTHPFQKWKEQRIYQKKRFTQLSDQYGYLAKQFTVFGQHIHVACPNGDDALYLCHAMARYIPHFIALTASSPFSQGVDTSFDCSRLTAVNAFPLSGTPPWKLRWQDFQEYYNKMMNLGAIKSMKDFYWDIRPKPEYGTVEIRVCDTPLTIKKAVAIAAFAQLLAYRLLNERPRLTREIYLTYFINRFRAVRYGLEADIIDPVKQKTIPLAEDILQVCDQLKSYTQIFDSHAALEHISKIALSRSNGATKLRKQYLKLATLSDLVRSQIKLWSQPV